jgi:hypothetical protein
MFFTPAYDKPLALNDVPIAMAVSSSSRTLLQSAIKALRLETSKNHILTILPPMSSIKKQLWRLTNT